MQEHSFLPRSTNATQYDIMGLERCDALFADPISDRATWRTTMDSDALGAMDRSILTMRFKDWKPVPKSEQTVKLNAERAYCYVFNSNDSVRKAHGASIQDPFLYKMSCSMDDIGALGNPPFITNIFKDTGFDNPHSTRMDYNKCVFEIDPSKVNSNSINNFWKGLANQECKSYKERGQADTENLASIVTACNTVLKLNTQHLNSNVQAFSNLVIIVPKYKQCKAEQAVILGELTNIREKYVRQIECEWMLNTNVCSAQKRQEYALTPPGKKAQLEKVMLELQTRVANLQAEKQSLNMDITAILADIGTFTTQSNNIGTQYNNLLKALTYCVDREVPDLNDLYARMKRDWDSIDKMVKVLEERRQILETEIRVNTENNKITIKEIERLRKEIASIVYRLRECIQRREELDNIIKTTQEEIDRLKKLLEACEKDRYDKTVERDYLLSLLSNMQEKYISNKESLDTKYNEYTSELLVSVADATNNVVSGSNTACANTSALQAQMSNMITLKLQEIYGEPAQQEASVLWCGLSENQEYKNACCSDSNAGLEEAAARAVGVGVESEESLDAEEPLKAEADNEEPVNAEDTQNDETDIFAMP